MQNLKDAHTVCTTEGDKLSREERDNLAVKLEEQEKFEGFSILRGSVCTVERGPTYTFGPAAWRKAPCWSDLSLLRDIALVIISEDSKDSKLEELAKLRLDSLRRRAKTLEYIRRRDRKRNGLLLSGSRLTLVTRILTWQHVKDCGSTLYISREDE